MNETVAMALAALWLALTAAWAAIALAPFARTLWARFRKSRPLKKAVWIVALTAATLYGGSKHNAGADEGIELAGLTTEYDATNDVTSVEILFTAGDIATNTPVSVRNDLSEQWRELEKLDAAISLGATNALTFAVSGNESTNAFWWVGFDTPAVVIETQGITITYFAASSSSVEMAWECDDPNAEVFEVQRRRRGVAEWETVGYMSSRGFIFVGFTVGETWEWRVSATYEEGE